jgi:hypothetical protein
MLVFGCQMQPSSTADVVDARARTARAATTMTSTAIRTIRLDDVRARRLVEGVDATSRCAAGEGRTRASHTISSRVAQTRRSGRLHAERIGVCTLPDARRGRRRACDSSRDATRRRCFARVGRAVGASAGIAPSGSLVVRVSARRTLGGRRRIGVGANAINALAGSTLAHGRSRAIACVGTNTIAASSGLAGRGMARIAGTAHANARLASADVVSGVHTRAEGWCERIVAHTIGARGSSSSTALWRGIASARGAHTVAIAVAGTRRARRALSGQVWIVADTVCTS